MLRILLVACAACHLMCSPSGGGATPAGGSRGGACLADLLESPQASVAPHARCMCSSRPSYPSMLHTIPEHSFDAATLVQPKTSGAVRGKSPRLYTARPHTRHRGQPSQDGPAANGFQPHYNLAAAHLARERRFSCSHLLGAPTQLFPPSGNKYYFTAVGWPVPWPARAAARVDGVRTLILLFVHTVILYSP